MFMYDPKTKIDHIFDHLNRDSLCGVLKHKKTRNKAFVVGPKKTCKICQECKKHER